MEHILVFLNFRHMLVHISTFLLWAGHRGHGWGGVSSRLCKYVIRGVGIYKRGAVLRRSLPLQKVLKQYS